MDYSSKINRGQWIELRRQIRVKNHHHHDNQYIGPCTWLPPIAVNLNGKGIPAALYRQSTLKARKNHSLHLPTLTRWVSGVSFFSLVARCLDRHYLPIDCCNIRWLRPLQLRHCLCPRRIQLVSGYPFINKSQKPEKILTRAGIPVCFSLFQD